MITALSLRIDSVGSKVRARARENGMLANRWIVLAAALVFWAVYFHTIDRVVMNGQGLPVGIDLMPK